ncbi:MAG: co-chaperone DjlA [Gammaproteobacteria bacterium]|nr:MAG: co-chaperone DjlA [Gammaproteobacteria bacterium]
MSWWGKIVGGAFGFALGGPLGALLGAALGHNLDRGLGKFTVLEGGLDQASQERVQTAFFTTTFSVMGHIAKADGTVSAHEIEMANQVMERMNLQDDQRKLARDLFRQGCQDGFPLDEVLQQFRRECHRRTTLLRMFMEIQISSAYADGQYSAPERKLLLRICHGIGFSDHEFVHLEAMVKAQFGPQGPSRSSRSSLPNAYAVLDVATTASDAEVKKAYRRLMNQHHPDKLVAKGLPEEMMKLAAEKTNEIKQAYETIKEQRDIR